MAKTEDVTKKTDDQLAEQLGELKREAFNLRFQAATGQLEKASRVKEVRRTIARIKTEQRHHDWRNRPHRGNEADFEAEDVEGSRKGRNLHQAESGRSLRASRKFHGTAGVAR